MTQTPLTDELVKELYEDAAKRKKAPVPVRDPFDRAIELCYELERQLAERDRQLAEAQRELQSIRSAELPVEPENVLNLRKQNKVAPDLHGQIIRYIDALKAYALKEKERADGLQKIQDEAESILFSVGDITCANGHKHKRHDGCLYCLAEKAESELAGLRGRLMDLDAKDWLDTLADADKAMSAVALKEGE